MVKIGTNSQHSPSQTVTTMIDYKFSINDAMKIAKKKTNQPGWEPYSWEKCGDDSIVTGDVPIGIFKSGSRKGRHKFKGPGQKVVVTKQEMTAFATEYEHTTGKCWDCHGEGKVVTGWSKVKGTSYNPCQRCKGLEIAQTSLEAAVNG